MSLHFATCRSISGVSANEGKIPDPAVSQASVVSRGRLEDGRPKRQFATIKWFVATSPILVAPRLLQTVGLRLQHIATEVGTGVHRRPRWCDRAEPAPRQNKEPHGPWALKAGN